jgi:hypothetical protein
VGGYAEHPRHETFAQLDALIENEAGVDERHEERAERNMSCAHSAADARTKPLGVVDAHRVAIARGESEANVALVRTVDVVADEAWVDAEVRDASSGCENAADLSHHFFEGINIGVDERHAERGDAGGPEWQLVRVAVNHRPATRPRDRELVG